MKLYTNNKILFEKINDKFLFKKLPNTDEALQK